MNRQSWEQCKMILPAKIQINKAKAQETKAQIDEGLALARKVDALRELKLTQEQNIKEWRDVTVRTVQSEINEWIQKRDMALSEAKAAERRRDEARKPLNFEWIKISDEKRGIENEKNTLFLDKQSFKIELNSFEKEKEKIEILLQEVIENEKTTKILKEEAEVLKKDAERQNVSALSERDNQNRVYERKIAEVAQSAEEYKVALQTIEVQENQVKEKEKELITRENDLTRRIKNLQRVEGIQK